MRKPRFEIQWRGNFIDGRFSENSDFSGEWELRSPADSEDKIGIIRYSYSDVDRAVAAARQGAKVWKKTPIKERIDALLRYQKALDRRGEEIVEVIAREVGKPLWEAKTELAAMKNKITITIEDSLSLVQEKVIPNAAAGASGVCRYFPLGVMAVVGPFNFPGHLPNGHIVPALMTGNSIVFKPSEKTPLIGQIMAECFLEAGLPPGVFNLLQGEKEVGRRLCVHEGVAGVLFTGSYEVGTRIKQDTLLQHWKLLALEMGGKNSALVWKDADMGTAVRDVLAGAFLTTGQRCSATSRIFVHSAIADAFIEKLHERSKAFHIGHPYDNPFMGPLIDSASVDRYLKFIGIAARDDSEVIMRGKALQLPEKGHYVSPTIIRIKQNSIEFATKSVVQQTEIFAPLVTVTTVDDLDHAIQLSNQSQFGLVSSVFSLDRSVYEHCLQQLDVGLVNWNRATVGASSKLPFGGLKKSGNHFPTAISAVQYCTYPVASLEAERPESGVGGYQGLNWSD